MYELPAPFEAFDIADAFLDTFPANELYPLNIDFNVLLSAFFNVSSSNSSLLPFAIVMPALDNSFAFLPVIPVSHAAFLNTDLLLDSPDSLTTSL